MGYTRRQLHDRVDRRVRGSNSWFTGIRTGSSGAQYAMVGVRGGGLENGIDGGRCGPRPGPTLSWASIIAFQLPASNV